MNWNKLNNDMNAHASDVDVDDIWAAIEPDVDALNRKRKRRGLIWFWWLGAGIGMIVLTWVLWTNNPSNIEPTISENVSPNATEVLDENLSELTNSSANNTISTTNTDALTNTSTDVPTDKSIAIENGTNKATTNSTEKGTSNTTNGGVEMSPVKNGGNAQNADNQMVNSFELNVASNSDVTISTSTTILETTQKSTADPIETVDELAVTIPFLLTDNPTVSSFFSTTIDTIYEENVELLKTKVEDAKSPPPTWTYTLGAHVGLSKPSRYMTLKEDGFGSTRLRSRDSTETILEATHIGLQMQLLHRKGFGLSTGLQRTLITERMDFTYSFTVEEVNEGITANYLTYHGETIPVYGELITSRTTIRERRHYSRYEFWEVPLLVHYQQQINDKWTGGLEVGAYVNLKLNVKGKALINNYEVVDIDEWYKKRIGVSPNVNVFVTHQLNENWHIRGNVHARYIPDISTIENPIAQRYTLVGGNIGVYYHFGK